MLKKDKTKNRVERHKITQEDFTPDNIVKMMIKKLPADAYTNFNRKILDPSAGIGNFLMWIANKRLKKVDNEKDAINAIYFLYGVELMADNVQECRERLYKLVTHYFPKIKESEELNYKLRATIKNRIRWHDSLKFDYDNWPRLRFNENYPEVSFEEKPKKDNPNFPMWEE